MARSKKEIDKELMYKKIMPTSTQDEESDSGVPSASLPLPTTPQPIEQPTSATTAMPMAEPSPSSAAAPAVPFTADEPQAPQAVASTAPVPSAPAPMAVPQEISQQSQDKDEPVNIMEILLEDRLDAAMDKFRCCNCDKCRKDIIAITLNKLPPYYIATKDAAKMAEAESKYAGQVATALVQAILVVKSHPSH